MTLNSVLIKMRDWRSLISLLQIQIGIKLETHLVKLVLYPKIISLNSVSTSHKMSIKEAVLMVFIHF